MREWDAIDGEDATVVASRNEYERYASGVEQIRDSRELNEKLQSYDG